MYGYYDNRPAARGNADAQARWVRQFTQEETMRSSLTLRWRNISAPRVVHLLITIEPTTRFARSRPRFPTRP